MANRKTSYTMQRGMVDYFMNLLNLPRGEVWSVIKEACHECVDKLANNSKSKSWRYAEIPGSDIKLRVDVYRCRYWNHTTQSYGDESYLCEVKFSNISPNEDFTDEQIEDYIVEKILLQVEDS